VIKASKRVLTLICLMVVMHRWAKIAITNRILIGIYPFIAKIMIPILLEISILIILMGRRDKRGGMQSVIHRIMMGLLNIGRLTIPITNLCRIKAYIWPHPIALLRGIINLRAKTLRIIELLKLSLVLYMAI